MEECPGGSVVKDPVLSLLWLWLLLWFGFDPWPKGFCPLRVRVTQQQQHQQRNREMWQKDRCTAQTAFYNSGL